MSPIVQQVIVALLVAGAVVYAAWRLMSGALRLRAIEALLRVLPAGDSGLVGWLHGLATKQRTATGCSACERNPENRG
jgi:hypothetical protein